MRKGVLAAWIAAAASVVLITAALTAGPKPGESFDGSSAHGRYGLFIQAQCSAGCASPGAVAVVQLTAGTYPIETGTCPYGADQLANAPIVNGSFSTGQWLWIAKKTFAYLWVSGTFVTPTRVVGRIQGPPQCGGPDSYVLHTGSA